MAAQYQVNANFVQVMPDLQLLLCIFNKSNQNISDTNINPQPPTMASGVVAGGLSCKISNRYDTVSVN